MGRAYPTKWQTTPVVFNERPTVFCPITAADGNGNVLYMPSAVSDLAVERIIRAALSQMGRMAVSLPSEDLTDQSLRLPCRMRRRTSNGSRDQTLGCRTHHFASLAHRSSSGSSSPK